MKIKYLPLFANLLFFSIFSKGQTPDQMIPPSPTAYSLGKYGDIPVSLYTGVPNITIPVTTLSNHDASVNVSLSYHGSGIKVDEVASFVGLGWSLNAGGVITRVVRGLPETLFSDGTFLKPRANITFYDYNTNPSKNALINANKLDEIVSGGVDAEADVFYFNFMGKAGKFYFDKTGKVILEKEEGIEIKWEYISSGFEQFTIKDELGNIYEFNDYETTYLYGVNQQVITAWYLSKLTSPNGNQINFEYSGGASSSQLVRSYATSIVDVYSYYTPYVTPPTNIPYSGTNYSEIRLIKISSDNAYIELKYKNETRQDYQAISNYTNIAWTALDEILLKHTDGSLIKKFKLVTSYFEANNIHKYNGVQPSTYSFLNYRLRLDGMQEYSSDNTSNIPAYTFSYLGDNNPSTDDPYTLPYRLSPSQDHWGYYNHTENTHMIPGTSTNMYITMPAWFHQFINSSAPDGVYTSIEGGANREPNSEALKAGLLKEVHYPTGGLTEFVFEANDYTHNIGGARIGKVISHSMENEFNEMDYTYAGYCPYNPKDYYFEYYKIYGAIDGNGNHTTLPNPFLLNQFGIPSGSLDQFETRDYVKVIVQPQAILGPGSQVGYDVVTEIQPGNGSVKSYYESPSHYQDYTDRDYWAEATQQEVNKLDKLFVSEFIDGTSYSSYPAGIVNTKSISSKEWPYPEIYSNEWKRGLLTDRYTSSNTKLLKEEHFSYFLKLRDVIPSWKVLRTAQSQGYVYSQFGIPNTLCQLKSSQIINYDNNGLNPLTTLTEYFYDNDAHLQPTRTEISSSKGIKEVLINTYPLDYATGTTFIENMKTRHLLAYPIEQVKYLVNGSITNIVSGSLIKYKSDGNGLKDQILKLETVSPINLSSFKFSNYLQGVLPTVGTPSTFSQDNAYRPSLNFNSYDSKGNILEIQKSNDIKQSYLWGYNKTYLVAQVTGADYATISGLVIQAILDDPQSTEAQIRAQLDNLRGGLASTKALVTTYTYKPLVGVTSQTDPNGRTTYYEYDAFGRLSLVRDKDNNILKKICYNYAGQPEDCGGCVSTDPIWQVSYITCESYRGSGNTGYQIVTETDANPCSPTYNQVRDSRIYNPSICPPSSLCDASTCSGDDHKCIGGVCEQGVRTNMSSVKVKINSVWNWRCTWRYCFSDGTSGHNTYAEISASPCSVVGNCY